MEGNAKQKRPEGRVLGGEDAESDKIPEGKGMMEVFAEQKRPEGSD